MKKVLILLVLSSLVLTGCGKDLETTQKGGTVDEQILNFEAKSKELYENVKNLKDGETLIFADTNEINNTTLLTEFGVLISNIDDYSGAVSVGNNNMYLIIKPTKEGKEKVKAIMKDYFEVKINQINIANTVIDENGVQTVTTTPEIELLNNRVEEEYKDYLIYIVSSNNNLVLQTIKANI